MKKLISDTYNFLIAMQKPEEILIQFLEIFE